MLKRMILFCVVILLAASLLLPLRRKSYAQGTIGYTAPGTITNYSAGYGADFVEVSTSSTFVPNGCTGPAYYAVNPADPGNRAMQAAMLGAFLAGKKVQFALFGCDSSGRPVISAVGLIP
jgi:hypothetical protein